MWSAVRTIFKFFFPVNDQPPVRARCADPESAFKTYDEEFYADVSRQPEVYNPQDIVVDQKQIQEKFLDIIKYYNDVIMTKQWFFPKRRFWSTRKKFSKLKRKEKIIQNVKNIQS